MQTRNFPCLPMFQFSLRYRLYVILDGPTRKHCEACRKGHETFAVPGCPLTLSLRGGRCKETRLASGRADTWRSCDARVLPVRWHARWRATRWTFPYPFPGGILASRPGPGGIIIIERLPAGRRVASRGGADSIMIYPGAHGYGYKEGEFKLSLSISLAYRRN